MTKEVNEIDSVEQYDSIISYQGLVVIDYHAVWCGPCKQIAPIYERTAAEYPDVQFCKINVDTQALGVIVNNNRVSSLPTFIIYKNGKEVERVVGANITQIINGIKKHL